MLRAPSGRIEWEPPPPQPPLLRRTVGPFGGRFLFLRVKHIRSDSMRQPIDNLLTMLYRSMGSPNPRPNLMYEWEGHAPPAKGWRFSRGTMERLAVEGRIWYPDSKAKRPKVKRYLDEMPGTRIGSVWADLANVHPWSRERLGYPTQKPLALLERIIQASSNPGDIVLDPFCGCGTTLVAAQSLGRRWLGIDISPTAVNLMKERLERLGASVKLVGMPVNEDQLRELKPFEFQNWVIHRMHGTHAPRKTADMGVDGYSFMLHEPIQVKQSESVGRPVVDGFQTAVERSKKAKGYIVAFSFTKGAHEEAARIKVTKGIEVVLVRVGDLLKESPDIVTPQPGLLLPELPLPGARSPEARPSVEELIASGHDSLAPMAVLRAAERTSVRYGLDKSTAAAHRIPPDLTDRSGAEGVHTVAKVSPFHSIKQQVHHNNSNCNTGNNIERENRQSGTGGKPLCQECAGLS